MGGFFNSPPAFNPPQPPIPLGAAGTVLTVVGGSAKFAAGSASPALGTSINFASPAGANNNVNPAGFGATVGAIIVTLAGGAANWTGLQKGIEGQTATVENADPANNLTLNSLNAGSLAANQFVGPGDFVIPPNGRIILQYRGALNGGSGAWSMG